MNRKLTLLLLPAVFSCTAQQRKEFEMPARTAARGLHGAIAGGSEWATQAGMRLYYQGGNAVDAGIATMFAAAVTEFSHIGMGGEAPILIRTKEGKVYAIAGVGTMPKAASADFFRSYKPKPNFEVLSIDPGGFKGFMPVAGLLPALVPGLVDGGLVAIQEFGTKSFAEIIQPAIDLADGMALDEMRSGSIARSRRFFEMWPDSKKTFMPNGRVPMPGEIFRQANLAKTLRSMAAVEKAALEKGASRKAAIEAVRDYFYRGEIAHRIDAFSRANGGLLRYEDMAAFHVAPEEPVSTDYRGYKIYKPGFWTQGPSLIEALNILEGFDMRTTPQNSSEYIHREVEALKLAYADRDTYYGDPKFNHIPADVLLSKQYAAERRKLITERASLEFIPGTIHGKRGQHPSETEAAHYKIDDALMAHDTTCVDAIDRDGTMLSITPSGGWLPSVIAGDTGIALTARGQQFLLAKGSPNEVAGGKRPRVTLSPTLVLENGRPSIALSTAGGDNQDQALLQVFMNIVEFGMNAQAAVEAPRFQTRHMISSFDNHAWNIGDLLLDERIPSVVAQELAEKGHRVGVRSRWGSGSTPVAVKVLTDGVLEAGADPYTYRIAHAW